MNDILNKFVKEEINIPYLFFLKVTLISLGMAISKKKYRKTAYNICIMMYSVIITRILFTKNLEKDI